jgi:hypothetical protein
MVIGNNPIVLVLLNLVLKYYELGKLNIIEYIVLITHSN